MSFDCFLADMGERPPGTTLDRKLNSEGYSADNCRWATSAVQGQNKRNVREFLVNDKWLSIREVRDLRYPNAALRSIAKLLARTFPKRFRGPGYQPPRNCRTQPAQHYVGLLL